MAIQAGIPYNIIRAYAAHAENIKYVNCYPTGYGRIRTRTASIAQGCPCSMRFLTILLCPWAKAAKLAGTIPRVLADDLMVFCTGEGAHIKAAKMLVPAHEFILDLKGKVNVEKTWAFGHNSRYRETLRMIRLTNSPEPCAIVHEHRGLGGHTGTTTREIWTTITETAFLTAA